jgi:hypothetical protein
MHMYYCMYQNGEAAATIRLDEVCNDVNSSIINNINLFE